MHRRRRRAPPPSPAPQIQDASSRVAEARRVADVAALQARLRSKENDALADGVWDDAAAGQALMAEIADLKSELQKIQGWAGLTYEYLGLVFLKRGRACVGARAAARAAAPLRARALLASLLAAWPLHDAAKPLWRHPRGGTRHSRARTRAHTTTHTRAHTHTHTHTHHNPRSFESSLEEAAFAVELIEAEGGAEGSPEGQSMLQEALSGLAALGAKLERWELRRLLAGPHDGRGAVLTVQAGAGGVDAMDWAEMLERM